MTRREKKIIKFGIPILALGVAIVFFAYGCSPSTIAEYKGSVNAEIINWETRPNSIVIAYNLGSAEIVDELKCVSNAHFYYLKKHQGKEVPFYIEITSKAGSW